MQQASISAKFSMLHNYQCNICIFPDKLTKFWSIFCACHDLKSIGFDSQFSYLAKNFDFQKMEYSKLKFYREKQHMIPAKNNDLVQDLILCNELDLVFNILMETEPQTEKYLDNYLK